MRPVSALVIVCFPFSFAFASPPEDTIKLNPPKINKTRQITTATTREFFKMTLTRTLIDVIDCDGARSFKSISKVYEKIVVNTRLSLYNSRMILADKQAAAQFYHIYRPGLLAFVRSKIANPHEAEDVVQDTLFAFLESLRDFHGKCLVSTYLFSICRHKIVDYYRKKKIKQIVFSHAPEIEDILSPLLSPEESLDAVMLKEKLYKTLKKILPQYRYILQARYIFDMPVADIAKKLTTTLKSAEMTLFRARKAFIQAYEKQ